MEHKTISWNSHMVQCDDSRRLEHHHVHHPWFTLHVSPPELLHAVICVDVRAEGSSKIQARIEQQSVRSSQPSSQFRAPTKPGAGVKTSPSPSKDNPSPEPQLDDIKRGEDCQEQFHPDKFNFYSKYCFVSLAELRAEVEVIEQMSSSGSSSSSDSASASGSGDDSSSSSDGEHDAPRPLSQTSPNRHPVANGGADRQHGNNQLMNTLREYLTPPLEGSKHEKPTCLCVDAEKIPTINWSSGPHRQRSPTQRIGQRQWRQLIPSFVPPSPPLIPSSCLTRPFATLDSGWIFQFDGSFLWLRPQRWNIKSVFFIRCIFCFL